MRRFEYQAVNGQGTVISGILNAENDRDLDQKLAEIGLTLLSCKVEKRASRGWFRNHRVTLQDLAVFAIQMEQLNQAGVPLLLALQDTAASTDNPAMRDMLSDTRYAIEQGQTLSEALSRFSSIVDPVFVGLIRAGEQTGQLAEVFSHLAKHFQWLNDTNRRIKKATYYPAFLVAMIAIIFVIMMYYVVPKLVQFLMSQGFALPWHTRALIAFSGVIRDYGFLALSFLVIGTTALVIGIRVSETLSLWWHSFVLRLPLVGMLVRKLEMARFCRFFSLLIRSGVGMLDTLKTCQMVVHNRALQYSMLGVKEGVEQGLSLTEAFERTGQFSGLVVRMVRVGEETGRLDHAFETVNRFYDQDVEEMVDSLLETLQPALTILMGSLLLWVVVAVFGPLYQSITSMQRF